MSLWKGRAHVENTVAPAEPSPRLEVRDRVADIDGKLAALVGSGRARGPMVDRLLDFRLALRPPVVSPPVLIPGRSS